MNPFNALDSPSTDAQRALDEAYMRGAIWLARQATREGDAAYGCVIVRDHRVIGEGRGSEKPDDCTCHSEVIAVRAAQAVTGGDLLGASLYSTFEPCAMCCGAICHSKVSRVLWGASRADLPDLYRRRTHTAAMLLADTSNPPELVPGILRDECVAVTATAPWYSTRRQDPTLR